MLKTSNKFWTKMLNIANLQHNIIIIETATNSAEQYDWRNNIETTGIPDIWDKNLEHSANAVFKAADFQISHNNIDDHYHIWKLKDNSKKTIVKLVNQKILYADLV